nr:MAG TPA: hypothetical protein [Bacteriophage sp.]
MRKIRQCCLPILFYSSRSQNLFLCRRHYRPDRTIPDKARKWWGRLHERGNKDHRKDFRGKYPLPQFHCRENAKIVL